ncbi:hypothetical protein BGZ76_004174, partial [Entomortierella beljakovae]
YAFLQLQQEQSSSAATTPAQTPRTSIQEPRPSQSYTVTRDQALEHTTTTKNPQDIHYEFPSPSKKAPIVLPQDNIHHRKMTQAEALDFSTQISDMPMFPDKSKEKHHVNATNKTTLFLPAICHKSYSTGIRPRAPSPILLGSVKDQAEFEQLVKMPESESATSHHDA